MIQQALKLFRVKQKSFMMNKKQFKSQKFFKNNKKKNLELRILKKIIFKQTFKKIFNLKVLTIQNLA